ncbi:MAG TPA: class I SAM-dependent methyltransferase [bacterium]|nr:class I SAM-dependent methyltransferase [bacterium]HNH30007.1 class I SAM-dependent methyltransferase [bacterium]
MSSISEQKHQRVVELENELRSENFKRPQYRYGMDLVKATGLTKGRIIEFGGGRGEFSRLLKDHGFEVVFTDINQANVEFAKSIGFEGYVIDANSGMADQKADSYDGAVMLEVIEHVTQAELLLKETHRILKPGGFLVLSTPNPYFLWRRLSVLFGKPIDGEGYHWRYFTVYSLESTLRESGFTIITHNHYASTFGLGKILKLIGYTKTFRWPRFLHGLLVRKIYFLMEKRDH